jgi:hypothetical protein
VTSASVLLIGGRAERPAGPDLVLEPDTALLVTRTGQAFLLDMADRFYALPPLAVTMLQASLQRGMPAAVQDIVARYDVDPGVAERDLRRFIDDLRRRATCAGATMPRDERPDHGVRPRSPSSRTLACDVRARPGDGP